MEIKARLTKPCTDIQRNDFIVEQSHNNGYDIRETDTEYQAWGYTESEKATQRQNNFNDKFLSTSKGYYRLQPKGYANAQQSIDTINNMVTLNGSLTSEIATMILFYQAPDFTKEEECTEEWLIQHQYSATPMTLTEWQTYYIEFTTKYAQKRYQQELQAQQTGA